MEFKNKMINLSRQDKNKIYSLTNKTDEAERQVTPCEGFSDIEANHNNDTLNIVHFASKVDDL